MPNEVWKTNNFSIKMLDLLFPEETFVLASLFGGERVVSTKDVAETYDSSPLLLETYGIKFT